MPIETKDDFDDDKPSNPRIMKDYYIVELEDIIDYDRDDARGLVIKFKVDQDKHNDVEILNDYDLEWSEGEIVLPFFAPAKLSVSEDAQSSRLSENLVNLGLHDTVLDVMNSSVSGLPDEFSSLKDAVNSGGVKFSAKSEDEASDLIDALKSVLKGKSIRVDVDESDESDESQVSELDRVFEEEDSNAEQDEILGEDSNVPEPDQSGKE